MSTVYSGPLCVDGKPPAGWKIDPSKYDFVAKARKPQRVSFKKELYTPDKPADVGSYIEVSDISQGLPITQMQVWSQGPKGRRWANTHWCVDNSGKSHLVWMHKDGARLAMEQPWIPKPGDRVLYRLRAYHESQPGTVTAVYYRQADSPAEARVSVKFDNPDVRPWDITVSNLTPEHP